MVDAFADVDVGSEKDEKLVSVLPGCDNVGVDFEEFIEAVVDDNADCVGICIEEVVLTVEEEGVRLRVTAEIKLNISCFW